MTRPPLTRLVACLATGLVAAGLAWLPGSAEAVEEEATPLRVSIDALTPSTVPRRGDITIAGQVTNRSDSTWTDLRAYMFTSDSPMTTGDELTEASQTDPASEVGQRICCAAGHYDEIGDLAPGESTTYFLSVPRQALPIPPDAQPGVYWLGVHVLGANEDGRDEVADGRARSFLPLMRNRGPSASVSLVVPVKGELRRRTDGTLFNLKRWQRDLSANGRLGRLMDLLGTSVSTPTTLVVDPAVVDAAVSVAADDPPFNTAPTDGSEEPAPVPSPSPSDGAGEPSPEDTSGSDDELPVEPSPEAVEAADWLNSLVDETATTGLHDVLTVPYGDADVAAMLRNDFNDLYRQAVDLSTATMEDLGIESAPVVAPPHGRIPNAALEALDPDTTLLLSDRAAPGAETSLIETENGHDAVLTSSSVSNGGPSPAPRFGALALRQRILSEAAVHALTGADSQPLVVTTPQLWDPGTEWRSADFFGGLDVPWLHTVDLTSATAVAGAVSGPDKQYDAPLAYPRASLRAELPTANLLVSDELRATGVAFAALLTRNDTVDEALAKTAMLASSVHARERRHRGVVATRRVSEYIRSLMARVSIDGPPFVTMSSGQGTFQVTVVNDLDQPVTVGIRPDTAGDGLLIEQPQPVSLGPGQRASVRLKATSTNIGVYSVTLVPTTSEGHQLSGSTKLSIRSSQVGLVIWIIMGVGAAILFVAIAIRITRRIGERRSNPVPPSGSESE